MVALGMEGSPYPNAWAQTPASGWNGTLLNNGTSSSRDCTILLESGAEHYAVAAHADGTFSFKEVQAGLYSLTVRTGGRLYRSAAKVSIPPTISSVVLILGHDGSL